MTDLLHNLTAATKQIFAGAKQIKKIRLSHLRKAFSLMAKWEKIAIGLLAVLALVSLLLSCRNFYYGHSVLVPSSGGSYTEGMIGQPTYINPLLAHQEPDLSLVQLVFSGLYKYDNNGDLTPDLADGMPSISADQKQYTINLKRNAKWHNGKPLTADDVVFTVQALQNPEYKSPAMSMWQSTTVEKLSDYSVKFTTKDVSGPFLENLTLPILPKSVWGHVDPQNFLLSDNNLKAVGTGPYAVKEIRKLSSGRIDQITFTAFSDYYAGRPKINTITIKFYDTEDDVLNALHSREITGYGFASLGSSLYLQKNQSDLHVLTLPLPQYQVVFFNLNNKVLSDVNVRNALSLAVDRQKIINDALKGQALLPSSPLLSGQNIGVTKTGTPNLTAATKLLDDNGWKLDPKTGIRSKKGQLLEFNLTTNDSLTDSDAAQALLLQWQALGTKVNLSVLPTQQVTDSVIRQRNFGALLFPQKFNADPDPFVFWHSSQVRDPGLNLTGFADPSSDKLITQARATTDPNSRTKLYAQFNQVIESQTPIILLDQAVYTYALSTEIKNVGLQTLFDPSQRFYDLPNWYITEKRVLK